MKAQPTHRGSTSNLSVQKHDEFGKFVIKSLANEYPTPREIESFLQEFHICKDLEINGIRKVHGWEKGKQSYHIYLEHVEGITLSEYQTTNPSLAEFLTVFKSIARSLSDLHLSSIIHNRLSPKNIIVKTDALDVTLIDFSNSTTYTQRASFKGNPLSLNADIHYLAPEQTGRLNRIIDHRSDLYALGVMLYEFVASHPPFKNLNQFEIIHAHIAIKPKSLSDLDVDCHGVFAPNSNHRALITPAGRGKGRNPNTADALTERTPAERHVVMTWAQRLKRVFNIDIKTCQTCGATMKVIACIEDPDVIRKILTHMDAIAPATTPAALPKPRASPQTGVFNTI